MFNVFQFLPQSFFVTSRGVESNAYAALTDSISQKLEPKAVADDPALFELLNLTVPEVQFLLQLIIHAGLCLPEPGFELPGAAGEVIATAELAWPSIKLALLLESEFNSEHSFAEAGWITRQFGSVESNPQEFLVLLKKAGQTGELDAN